MNHKKALIAFMLLTQSGQQQAQCAFIQNLYNQFWDWLKPKEQSSVYPSPQEIYRQPVDDTHVTFVAYQPYSPKVIAHLFAQAAMYAAQYPSSGYRITSGPIAINPTADRAEVHLQLSGAAGNPTHVPTTDADSCVFCHPTTKILYDDKQTRVLTKPGNRPGTDILIVPTEHTYLNVAAMNFTQDADTAVIERLASVADTLAHTLDNKQATYTLTTNTGIYQGVYHLHMHFKSDAKLTTDNLTQTQ